MQTFFTPWAIFDELERSVFGAASSWEWPQFDIEDSDDETVLTADLPGMTDDDIDVTVTGSYLIVRGQRTAKNARYTRRSRFYGSFERRFWIGDGYDVDSIAASLANGVLTIRLEKTARARPRRIKLTSGMAAKVKGLLAGDKDKRAA